MAETYAMPSHIAERHDAADLWTAFLSATAREDPWTPEQLNWFVQGWDKCHFYGPTGQDLEDAIGDAVERGLCTPLRIADGEDLHTVRALARASAIANPDVIRRVALITRSVLDALSTSRGTGDVS